MVSNWPAPPETIAFNITHRCNLRCEYCFEEIGFNATEPSFEEAKDILDQLNAFGVKEILLEGGEIFLVPYIFDLLEKVIDYDFRVHVISNGTLINPEVADYLSCLGISIGISLDGPTPETNIFRGAIAFHKALSAIRMLVDKGMTVYINCVVTRSNYAHVAQLAKLCHDAGAYGLVLQQLHCSGRANASFFKSNHITIDQLTELKIVYKELAETYPDIYFVNSEVFDFLNARERYHKVCSYQHEYFPQKILRCGAGQRFCVIQPDLSVIPCGILGNFPCGNLKQQSFQEIWHHSEGFNFLRQMSEYTADMIPGCSKCPINAICDGGCRGDMYNYSGEWLGTHIACPFAEQSHI
ncbi:MAG: radical SAM protein [Syntrophobacteraceae bacterium]